MTDLANPVPIAAERPPPRSRGILEWLRVNLFGGVFNTILTLLALYLLAVTIPPFIRWAFIDAVWSAPNGRACRGPGGEEVGACWAFIGEKLRFILFGRYPYDRAMAAAVVVVADLCRDDRGELRPAAVGTPAAADLGRRARSRSAC